MPKGDPRKPFSVVSLTEEEKAFAEKAISKRKTEIMRFVREATMEYASKILGKPAPGMPQTLAAPTRPSIRDILDSGDPLAFERYLEAFITDTLRRRGGM